MDNATTSIVFLVGMVEWLLFAFSKAIQVSYGMLQRLGRSNMIKGENGEKVCFFEVVLFTLFFGCLMCLSTMSSIMV